LLSNGLFTTGIDKKVVAETGIRSITYTNSYLKKKRRTKIALLF